MIIVKNLSLPDCCAVCKLTDFDDDGIYCNALGVFMHFDELPKGRRPDCPIFDENVETIQSIVLIGRNGNAAEYEKVTRCKDCEECMETKLSDGQRWNYCELLECITENNDFCCWAERKNQKIKAKVTE